MAASAGLITAVVGLLAFMSTPAPTITEFDASPNIVYQGDSSILKWSVTGTAETVDIEPEIGIVALSGSREVTPSATTNYTLTARNKDKVKTATLQLVVAQKKVEPDAGNASSSKETLAQAPAPATQSPNVIVVTVPAANTQIAEESVPPADVQTKSKPAEEASEIEEPVTSSAVSSVPAENASSAQEPVVQPAEESPSTAPEQSSEATASVIEDPATGALYSERSQYESAPAPQPSMDAGSSPGTMPPAASIGGTSEPKPGVKQITSADWNPSASQSSSLEEMSQEAPIYSKLKSSATGHQPGESSDSFSTGSTGSETSDPLSMGLASPDVSVSELP